ncbi:L-rhamnose mutarotase [uncultured Mucilaginibacter sp.]|nr:L-rhamnose mutarotase [uncultured Mucilaginibacter sp.]
MKSIYYHSQWRVLIIEEESMHKVAFKMKLKPGFKDEYKKRHDEIWPELSALLKANGISDYTIFLDEETNTLFGVQIQSGQSSQDLGSTEIVQKWWAYMADIMDTNPDNSPVSTPLTKVFHLD